MKSPLITLCALALVAGSVAKLADYTGQKGKAPLTAKNFKVVDGDRTTELEGICKVENFKATCWNPAGGSEPTLSEQITLKLEDSKRHGVTWSSTPYKTRLLVMKTIFTKNLNDGFWRAFPVPHSSPHQTIGTWTYGYSTLSDPGPVQTDVTRVERRYVSGRFETTTKNAPLQFRITQSIPTVQQIQVPVKSFTVDGNTFEVVSVSERDSEYNDDIATFKSGPTRSTKIEKVTVFKIRPIKITNTQSFISLYPADEKGGIYQWLGTSGVALTNANISPRTSFNSDQGRAVMGFTIHPKDSFKKSQPVEFTTNIPLSKIKKLAVAIYHLTDYDFGKIPLDPR